MNNTEHFKRLVDNVLVSENNYFNELENAKKTKGYSYIQKKVLDDYNISYCANANNDNQKLFSEYIKQFILSYKDNFTIKTSVLSDIAQQIHIDFLLGENKLKRLDIYFSLAQTLNHYGIYQDDKIEALTNKSFWLKLIKKLYLLNLISPHGFYVNLDESYTSNVPDFVNAIKFFKHQVNINLDCIDSKIILHKTQNDKIISRIEKKLQQVNIFRFINFILLQDRANKTIPFNYIINISLKNIYYSNFKKSDEKTFIALLDYFRHFINLYKLQSYNQWEYILIDEKNLEKTLKKQILYSSLYTLNYPLKTTTVIKYINNLIDNSILNKSFEDKFNFTRKELYSFLIQTEKYENQKQIMEIDLKLSKHLEQILNFFSIDSKNINLKYSKPLNIIESKNLFVHNPIIKYKGKYYIIGFKYFKMYFYNALVEKIRLQIDKDINTKIGNNIDNYVESIFKKNNFDIYTGEYKLSKKEKYECDLVVKIKDKIVFIENKNKALTKNSFAGSSIHILQDFIRAFATSQFQLFRHEKNLLEKQKLIFTNGKTLYYNNETIIKISLSPNNWYSIMNNVPKNMLLALMHIRFTFNLNAADKDIKEFEKTNKDLEKLTEIIMTFNKRDNLDSILHNSLFIPLELISENDADENFIYNILGLLFMKYNTQNIYDSYNQYKKVKNLQKNS
ncbi:hypothetical protein [Sulfurimonas sp. HSL3-2]|uniref:hypothetical protein n=1 Tax=Hydrocurvibacter mobilis TaxID=3131936 RepID=UPI0031F8B8B9